MSHRKEVRAKAEKAQEILDYQFKDPTLIEAALTHPSAAEGLPINASYERLEFLGDAILGAIVAQDLFRLFPAKDEGELSSIETALVAGETLSEVADGLGIGECIVFGESELGTEARGLHSALENVYEALVGAMYLDGGFEPAQAFVQRTLSPMMDGERPLRPVNAKSALQELVQRDLHCDVEYKLVSEEGPLHAPTFTSVVRIQGVRVGRGSGRSKKASEAAAAQHALMRLTDGTGKGQVRGRVLAHDFDYEEPAAEEHDFDAPVVVAVEQAKDPQKEPRVP